MSSLNKVMIIGRLGRDPELRYTSTGTPVANLNIATDEGYTDKQGNRVERTEWHRVNVWDRQAENCNTYLGKGSLVYVEGSLQTRQWQDQQGQTRYSTEIRAQRVQFLETRRSQGQGDFAPQQQQGRQQGGYQQQPPQQRQGPNQGPPPDQGPPPEDDMGSPFPSEASGMDDVPF